MVTHHPTLRRSAIVMASCVTVLVASTGPASATFRGQNGRIVLQENTVKNGIELITAQPLTGAWRRVTDVAGIPVYPDWSPDGRHIAFELDSPAGDRCRIELMRADGTGLKNLSHQRRGCEQNPSFTPNGRRIVFVVQRCMNCTERISSMSLRGHHRRRIVDSPFGMHSKDPNVAPNGKRVSFIAEGEQNRAALFIVGIHGHGLRKIVPQSFDVERKHDWAPNGRRILFNNNANEADLPSNLMTIRPDGTHLRRLTHFTGGRPNPPKAHVGSYSPDGRWIVYRRTIGDRTKWFRRPVGPGLSREVTYRRGLVPSGNGDWGAAVR
jgi:Tol biopolymer transport system component